MNSKKSKTESEKNNKRRKVLMATLIPVGAIAIAAAITIPLIRSCKTTQIAEIIELVVTPPNFTNYRVGDKLNLGGLKVLAKWSDNRTPTDVTNECTTNPGRDAILTSGMDKVIVTHTPSGKTAEFTINVIDTILESITVVPPETLSYYEGQKLDLTGFKVIGNYSNNTQATITGQCKLSISTETPLTKDMNVVTVTHTPSGLTGLFNIYVGDAIVTSISITPPTKTFYYAGEFLDLKGFKVVANWTDGREPTDITDGCTTNPNTLTPLIEGTTEVTVTHTESRVTGTFNISVNSAKIIDIEITNPEKTTYAAGELLNLQGMIVKAKWTDGRTPTDVTSQCSTSINTSTPLTTDIKSVEVTHNPTGIKKSFNITVGDAKINQILVTPPSKTDYYEGQKLDLKGYKVMANWTDGRTPTDVTGQCTLSPSATETLVKGTTTVTVTHSSGLTGSFNITVGDAIITDIVVTTPDKTNYVAGEMLNLDGFKVLANWTDGRTPTDVTTDCTTSISTFVPLTTEMTSVEVTHNPTGIKKSFSITVGNATISSLTVTPPTKTSYADGEKLNLEGFKVMANWTDSRTPTDVTNECTLNPGKDTSLVEGTSIVSVTHSSGVESYFMISVGAAAIYSLNITPPNKTSYAAGEKIDLAGFNVTANWTDGRTPTDVTEACTLSPSATESLVKGTTTITVTHSTGIYGTFDIAVGDATISSLTVTPPTKTSYAAGEKLNLDGFKVLANWTDGRTPTDVTEACTTNPSITESLTKGTTNVVVTHVPTNLTGNFSITVGDPVISSLIVTSPTKTTYSAGEMLDLEGYKVEASWTNGDKTVVTDQCTLDPTGATALTQGTTQVNVTHTPTGLTGSFNITVGAATITSIDLTPPSKTTYLLNETVTYEYKVHANWTDGRTPTDVTGQCTHSCSTDITKPGEHTITVTHTPTGKTSTYTITVSNSSMPSDIDGSWECEDLYASFDVSSLNDGLVLNDMMNSVTDAELAFQSVTTTSDGKTFYFHGEGVSLYDVKILLDNDNKLWLIYYAIDGDDQVEASGEERFELAAYSS